MMAIVMGLVSFQNSLSYVHVVFEHIWTVKSIPTSIEAHSVAILKLVCDLIEDGQEDIDTELAKVGQLFVVRRDG